MNEGVARRREGLRVCAFVLLVAAVAATLLTTGSTQQMGSAELVAATAPSTEHVHATTTARAAAKATQGLAGTYYRDAAFRNVAMQRVDKRVAYNWGAAAPARTMPKNAFAVRWAGSLIAPRTGTYRIIIDADDSVRLSVDGRTRINGWTRRSLRKRATATVRLTKGTHRIRLDYADRSGAAAIRLLWSGPRIREQVIPTTSLRPAALTPTPAPRIPLGASAWSNPATWGGTVPADGSSVTIPAGTTVLLDQDVSLANLTIDGSLVFASRDLTIEADWILLHGTLQVGSVATPFTQRAIIRLRDRTPGENVMGMGDKVLGVMGGTLELHGPKRVAWTRLGVTAPKGVVRITMGAAVDWRVGDRIAIASTDYSPDQREEATITAVSGRVLTLDHPLAHEHFGAVQDIAGTKLDERAEVALLTRTLTFEGESTSSAGGFGAQIVAMSGGTVHAEGVELQRVGQRGQLRRYPLHFHVERDGGIGSYLRNSSVHHTNNRCVTIHGTNGVVVDDITCYDHFGHGVFFEDGGEQRNTVTNSLVFGSRTPDKAVRLLPSDGSPASYWITNPDNVIRGNVAAGSEGPGFWVALPEHPTGFFATLYPAEAAATWPRRMALAGFAGNTAHSNDEDGLHFDDGPRTDGSTDATNHSAHADPKDPKSTELVTVIPGFTAWKNRGNGAWLRGSNHRLTGAVLADNAIGVTMASDESLVQDSVMIGESANAGEPAKWEVSQGRVGRGGRTLPRSWDPGFPIRGFEFYDGRVGVERTTFANFQPYTAADGVRREESALGYRIDNDFSIHPRNFASGARFVNAKPVYLETPEVGHDGDVSAVFLDADGSVTGTAGRTVTARNPFLYGTGCEARDDWNVQLCSGDYATLHVGAPGTSAAVKPVTLTRPDGQVQTLQANTDDAADSASSTIVTDSTYRVGFAGGTPARTRYVLEHGEGRTVTIAVPHAAGFTVTRWDCDMSIVRQWCFGAATSLAALQAMAKDGYWYDDAGDADPATGTLYLRIVAGADNTYDELEVR